MIDRYQNSIPSSLLVLIAEEEKEVSLVLLWWHFRTSSMGALQFRFAISCTSIQSSAAGAPSYLMPWISHHKYPLIASVNQILDYVLLYYRQEMKNTTYFSLSFKDNQVLSVKTLLIFFSVRIKIQVKELTYLPLHSTGIFIIQIYSLKHLLFMFALFAFIKCLALYIFLLHC